ncbi:MAG: endonuclease [Bacteroidales bacterium]|nr:endonuclease [Bacteroidales bacterium]
MRHLYFIALLCMSLAGCTRSVSDETTSFRLLYWNIQNGMWDGQGDNYDRFVSWVKAKNPDVCVWCEARSIYYTGTKDKLPVEEKYLVEHWPELAARYGHLYVYVGGMRDNYPQVITSRIPIHGMAKITGESSDTVVAHGAGWAQVTVGERTLNLVSIHTWPHPYAYNAEDQEVSKAENGGDAYRAMEVEYVCRHTIGSATEGNWLMMGDFNSISRTDNALYGLPADSPKFQAQDYMHDKTPYLDIIKQKYPEQVIVSTWIDTRYDYVFCTPDLLPCITNAEIVKDEYTTPVKDEIISSFAHPSDHLPIIVDFNF